MDTSCRLGGTLPHAGTSLTPASLFAPRSVREEPGVAQGCCLLCTCGQCLLAGRCESDRYRTQKLTLGQAVLSTGSYELPADGFASHQMQTLQGYAMFRHEFLYKGACSSQSMSSAAYAQACVKVTSMSYSEFTFQDLRDKLSLYLGQDASLFAPVEEVQVSAYLETTLRENVALALNINSTVVFWLVTDGFLVG